MLSSEEFWGCNLDAKNRICTWQYEEDDTAEHKLIVSQACLGIDAKEGERNVINITVIDDEDSSQTHTILSLRAGTLEQCSVSIGFTSTVKFELVAGSGPVSLVGSHLIAIDDEINDSDLYGEEHEDDAIDSDISLSDDMDDDVDDDVSGDEDIEDLGSADGPLKRKKLADDSMGGKKPKTAGGSILKKSDIDEDSDDDDESDDDDLEHENKPKKNQNGSKKDIKTIPSKNDTSANVEKVKASLLKMKNRPKTLEKLRNFVTTTHKITDPAVITDIWNSFNAK